MILSVLQSLKIKKHQKTMEKQSRIHNMGYLKRDLLLQASIPLKQRKSSIIQLLKLERKHGENYDGQDEIHIMDRCLYDLD